MKKINGLLICILLLQHFSASAQSFAINTDGTAANASALLDVKSTTKGLLIPRMTKAERNSIAAPATGLMIFQTGPDSIGFHYYSGSSWSWVSSSSNGSDWKLTGNAGTDTATHFVGTTDNMALQFKINNTPAGVLSNDNSLFGLGAGKAMATATGIVAIGRGALGRHAYKSDLVAVGDSALYNNNVGFSAAGLNATGNTAVGYMAMYANTGGYFNTALGYQALKQNTTSISNTAVGFWSLYSNVAGSFNTAVGEFSLHSNITGSSNTAIGIYSLNSNIAGYQNVAVGHSSMLSNTTGFNNTAIGISALYLNNGNDNSGFGFEALVSNTDGYRNTASGYWALANNQTGHNNTGMGYRAIWSNTTGSYITGIGDSVNVLASNLTNASAFGAKSAVGCSNCLVLGSVNGTNGATTDVNVGIGTSNPAHMLTVGKDIRVDDDNANNGTITNSLRFGASNSGEAVASKRTAGGNQWGLDFYTNSVNRLSIVNSGNVGIGTTAPAALLDVNGTTTTNGLQVSNGTVITKMQSGSVTVGASGSGQLVYLIAFPVAFATGFPRVFATARNQPATNFNDAFSVSVRSVTATSVTLNIQRTDTNASWAQNLVIDWFAVE